MGISGKLSPEQLHSFHSQGFLVIELFSSPEEIDAMRRRMDQLLDDFDCSTAASIFSTKNQQKLTDDYFYKSAEKISFFFLRRKHFGVLLENMKCSNVVFDVTGKSFHAYKLVLAARSLVFRNEFFLLDLSGGKWL
ncbi:hypothetical protein VitviT2T_027841 [Vitis vinifera]|uniref:BTB domain-containing protein n=1 Tax=Vitis vinifera TaxID=29760 RepID=A0ABY9DV34_VITVI|nr:hypothetical protein VitviT2T_027841 [Vitis vinifera]